MSGEWQKLRHKLQDGLLLEAVYDNLMKKTRFNTPVLSDTYNVFVGQKHRMLYYKKLKKTYLPACVQHREWEGGPKRANPDTVWFCWLQGLENAPPLVRRCHGSLVRHLGHKTIRVVDERNLHTYVTLPEDIRRKWEAGIIPPAQYTDLIRLQLLIEHGGYWVDATVFVTDAALFDKIDDLPLFMYSFYCFGFNPEIMQLNNWFILSAAGNDILCLTQKLLYAYWARENRLVNYFLFQIMMTIALEYYEDAYRQMPIVSQVDAHILASYIFDPFDSRKYELLKLSTGIHKLSTRFDPGQMHRKGTFYDHLVQGTLM